MKQYVDKVRQTAIAAGGSYIPYSQMLEPTNTMIKMLPATEDGICQALCAKWIAEHANDSSLWTWLFTPGTTNVQFGKIANLMVNFNETVTTNKNSAAFNTSVTRSKGQEKLIWQDVVTEKYLALYGVIRRGMARAKMNSRWSMKKGSGLGFEIGKDLNPALWNGQNFYVLISILGKGGGHALCAFIGATDIAFFDPNFGEFYFTDRGKFMNFIKKFWEKSGYGKDFNSYYLLDFGKRVGSR